MTEWLGSGLGTLATKEKRVGRCPAYVSGGRGDSCGGCILEPQKEMGGSVGGVGNGSDHSCSQVILGLKPPEGTEMGLCNPSKASAVTGHVFNMLHDNSKPCVGLNGPGSASRHVMAPVMAHVDPEEPWSPCSARFITDFLDNGYGKQTAAPRPGQRPVPAPCTVFSLLPHSARAGRPASSGFPLQCRMG